MPQPTSPHFYIGRAFDPALGKTSDQPILYDPANLTTHAVVTGMTGSGKTGLCVVMLEEAALHGIPAIIVDLKGDLTNLVLHFPEQSAQAFEPWLDPEAARRAGKDLPTLAAETAQRWEQGQADWGLGRDERIALQNAAQYTIFTPGSSAGKPVNILSSFQSPNLPWEENRELLREKIASTVTALLGLIGLTEIDPLRSREHILLANIMESAWSQNRPLDMTELILQIQTPPFARLGAFAVDNFFPKKERFDLAMLLNNFLAAPSFQSWLEGQSLDVPDLLYQPDGRPRHSIFYLAHLDDNERMFFVTLLFAAVEAWMRTQRGTSGLRALLYFDEIFGYMPPIGNPPTKPLMLRMLKQARAFGVGQLLVTQNPVDIDYKGLSNAGTWFIGKLQTERDKERLLDGLEGASGGKLDRKEYDKLISGLGKRIFLLHNVHESKPQLFQTRWVMNFLAGPLTRNQIPALNKLGDAPAGKAAPAKAAPAKAAKPPLDQAQPVPVAVAAPKAAKKPAAGGQPGSTTRPAVPTGVAEYFLPNNLSLVEAFKAAGQPVPAQALGQGMLYKPVLIAQANTRYLQRKYNLDYEARQAALVSNPDRRGVVRWEEVPTNPIDPRTLDDPPAPGARYDVLEAPLNDARLLKSLETDFTDWAYRRGTVTVYGNSALKLYAGPPATEADFRMLLSDEARKRRDEELKTLKATYQKKFDALKKKLAAEQRELETDRSEVAQRRMEELGTHFENIFGGKSYGRRRISSSLSKRRMTQQAKDDVDESISSIAQLEKEMEALRAEMEQVFADTEEKWGEAARQIEELPIQPYKKDILIEVFGVAWMPYHLVEVDGKLLELAGYA